MFFSFKFDKLLRLPNESEPSLLTLRSNTMYHSPFPSLLFFDKRKRTKKRLVLAACLLLHFGIKSLEYRFPLNQENHNIDYRLFLHFLQTFSNIWIRKKTFLITKFQSILISRPWYPSVILHKFLTMNTKKSQIQ